MATPSRVVLVDGTALIFRAWFALPGDLVNRDGLHTNAAFGFATMFRKLFAGKTPALGAVIFDAPGPTFREALYPDYKAQRPPMPQDLREQLPSIDALVTAHGFPILREPGFEADDVIGTLTRLARDAGHEVHIISGDKDFCQLIDDGVRMIDTLRDVTFDAELVRKKWGVLPPRFVDLLALMGDTADNIPGVPGIGAKGAAALLERFGDLDGVLAGTDQLKGKQRESLREHRDRAIMSRALATIDRFVPLAGGLELLELKEPDQAAIHALFLDLQFFSLISKEQIEALDDARPTDYGVVWHPRALPHTLEWLREPGPPVAIHPVFEVDDQPFSGLVGLAVARVAGTAYFLPLRGPGDRLGDAAIEVLRPWLEDASAPKLAHDWKRLRVGLRRLGIHARGCVFDVRLASFLVDPTRLIPHALPQLSRDLLQRVLPELKAVLGAGQALVRASEAPTDRLGAHVCAQVDAIVQTTPLLRERLDACGMTAQLLERDLPLSEVLADMEEAGILVDAARLAALGAEFRAGIAEHEARIYGFAGREFNIRSTKQLGEVLFDELGLPIQKRTKSGYSTDGEVLERLAKKGFPIAEAIVEHRSLTKLVNTYTDVLQAAIRPDTGRVHTTFQQTVGATGRLITTDPDLQRTPVATVQGRQIRDAFVAPPGHQILSADWSQIELRILAHVSADPALVEAFAQGWDVHTQSAAGLFGVPREEVTRAQRNVAKTVNFATIYGQGATALAQILDVPRPQAEGFITRWFATYHGVRTWLDRTMAEAEERGWVETMLGRRRTIPELRSNAAMDKQAGLRIAANTPIQGSAADLCKLVMLVMPTRLAQAGLHARMLLQIHDELLFEVPDAEVEATKALVRRVMETEVVLRVPLVVEVGVGPSWAEAH